MSYRKLVTRAALAVVAGFGITTSTWGAGATDNVGVTASVSRVCTVSASPVPFGAYEPVVTNRTAELGASGSLSVTCTNSSTAVTIELGLGQNSSGTNRFMKTGTGGAGEFLPYQLYKPVDSANNTLCSTTDHTADGGVWGTAAGGSAFTPSAPSWTAGTARVFHICGYIPPAQDVVPGNYTDTVLATVTY